MRRLALLLLFAASGCSQNGPADAGTTDRGSAATAWTAAERLFRGDRHWLGGDSAYSIDLGDLGGGRVLWLFGDSFVSAGGSDSRSGVPLVRNSIALQHGYDPTRATLDFHSRTDNQGAPSAFFTADAPDTWLWPGPGARLSDMLLVFLWRMKPTTADPIGFVVDRPEARLVTNPDDDPAAWRMMPVAVPANPWGVFLGTGAVVVENGYLHALSCVEPGSHDVYAARWPVDAVKKGQLGDPEWATGAGTWTAQSKLTGVPLRLFSAGHTEFSVHFDAATRQYVQIQATGFPGDLVLRTAAALTGPWSPPRAVYHPPELSRSGVFTYAGKAHPELRSPALGNRVAVTYASNSSDFFSLVRDMGLYYPRFLQLDTAVAIAGP